MRKTKFISFILAVIMLGSVGILSACNNSSDASNYPTTSTGTPVTEGAVHKVEGTLHKRSVSLDGATNVFIENGESKYKIIYDDSELVVETAAINLKNTIMKYMSVNVEFATSWDAEGYYIVINDKDAFQQAGLTMPSEDLQERGYYIKSKNNSVFIMSEMPMGAKTGVVDFLNAVFEYEYYATGIVDWKYSKTAKVMMPNIDITEKPDFAVSLNGNAYSTESATGWKMNVTSEIFVPLGNTMWHNQVEALPPSKFYASHPKWYSNVGFNKDDKNNNNQLCLTARGDTAEWNAMVNEVYNQMVAQFDANPDVNSVTFTMQDNWDMCECDTCKSRRNTYGTESANSIIFCNEVSKKLDAYYQPKGRNVKVLFFAYFYNEAAPTCSPSTLKCRDNVGVYIAPIQAEYNKSFYDSKNSSHAQMVKNWSKFTNNIYFWLYETNYWYYLFPLDSWDTMIETLRFCKENNGYMMFIEGQYNTANVTAFGKLKEYLNAKACWDVNVSFKDICDKYFPAMFREASDVMRQYFDELQIRCKYNYANYSDLTGKIYEEIAQSKCWPKAQLDTWLGYINKALKLVEPYKTSDPALYEALEKNIKVESIFIRYALLQFYTGYYSKETLKEMRNEFIVDCQNYGITNKSETVFLDEEFATWE